MQNLAFSISHSGATFVIIVMIMVIFVILILLVSMHKNKKKQNDIEIEQPVQKYQPKQKPKQQQQAKSNKAYAPPPRQQPENLSAHATVIEKTDERRKTVSTDGSTTISGEVYEVVFNLKDSGKKRFIVSRKVFRDIELGERGLLIFNREGFLKFKTQNGTIED